MFSKRELQMLNNAGAQKIDNTILGVPYDSYN